MASEAVEWARPGPESGSGHSAAAAVRMLPAGLCHAVSDNARVAVCGKPVDELHNWSHHSWSLGLVDRCPDCAAAGTRRG